MSKHEELERKLEASGELTEAEVVAAFERAKEMGARIESAVAELQGLSARIARLSKELGDDDLLTSKEVAEQGLVGVTHHKTIEAWARPRSKKGGRGLPCVHLGRNVRFRRGDVLAWRAQQEK